MCFEPFLEKNKRLHECLAKKKLQYPSDRSVESDDNTSRNDFIRPSKRLQFKSRGKFYVCLLPLIPG